MKNQSLLLLLFIAIFSFSSCEDSEGDSNPLFPGSFNNGVFILNEGGYTANNASLSFTKYGDDEVYNDIFFNVTGNGLGDVLNSAYQHNNQLYLVMNGSGTIEVVKAGKEFTSVGTITGLLEPRYMVADGGTAYVTEWISFLDKGKLSVVDLSNLTVTQSVDLDYQPEGIAIANDQLFISQNGSASVWVLSLADLSVTKKIAVAQGPGGIVKDADGDVWVLCGGGYDLDWNEANDGAFYEINPETLDVTKSIEFGMNVSGKPAVSPSGDVLYYYSSTSVYALGIDATQAPTEPIISESSALGFYGIGVAPNGNIYVSDAKDYVQNGSVFRYEEDGIAIDQFEAGLIPSGFIFQ